MVRAALIAAAERSPRVRVALDSEDFFAAALRVADFFVAGFLREALLPDSPLSGMSTPARRALDRPMAIAGLGAGRLAFALVLAGAFKGLLLGHDRVLPLILGAGCAAACEKPDKRQC